MWHKYMTDGKAWDDINDHQYVSVICEFPKCEGKIQKVYPKGNVFTLILTETHFLAYSSFELNHT